MDEKSEEVFLLWLSRIKKSGSIGCQNFNLKKIPLKTVNEQFRLLCKAELLFFGRASGGKQFV